MTDVLVNANIYKNGTVSFNFGHGPYKTVSFDNFLKSIEVVSQPEEATSNTSTEEKCVYVFPDNLVSAAHLEDESLVINLHYEERSNFPINYEGDVYTVSIPNVFIQVHLAKVQGQENTHYIKECKWYTVLPGHPIPTHIPLRSGHPSGVVVMPMFNMYSSGSMCYGSNQLPRNFGYDFRVLATLYEDIFLKSTFNSDLMIPSVQGDFREPDRWIDYLETNSEQFPYDILVN